MRRDRNQVITIAGLDPSAGAGILADIKTFGQMGVYGFAACTAITLQTEDEFKGVSWIPIHQVELQLDTLLQKYEVDFLKIGLIHSFTELHQLVQHITMRYPHIKIVWDPILRATSGFVFHTQFEQKLLIEILSNIYLITPNSFEACQLGNSEDPMAAAEIMSRSTNVFLKSYCDDEMNHYDVLIEEQQKEFFKTELINGMGKHGSGCVLSAALTSALASGFNLSASSKQAKDYAFSFLMSGDGLLGDHSIIQKSTIHA